MFESSALERKSRERKARWWLAALFLANVSFAVHAPAQTAQPTSLEMYANAMKQPRVADQIAELERYLASSGADNSVLKQDALEVLTWDYIRMGSVEHVKQRAQQLLALDPRNPVALAGLAEEGIALPGSAMAKTHAREKNGHSPRIDQAQAALTSLEQLRRPEGMGAGDFAAMRRRAESRLNGVLGLAYVDREEYQQARTPLQQAVAVDPTNPQYTYALGLALLMGKDPADQQSAFLYLARASNLTQGTASGTQISEYARKEYHKAGGKDAEWNQFLAAAVAPAPRHDTPTMNASTFAPAAPAVNRAPTGNNASPANTSPTNTSATNHPPLTNNAGKPGTPKNSSTASIANHQPPAPGSNERAAVTPPDVNAHPVPTPWPIQPAINTPNAPISLGILIETALLTKQNRDAIIATLKDLTSHLRAEDEAALLVFSNQLDFEQDLTANDNLLEQAMSSLRPRPGKALLDGVAFAAGHLRRIGKNTNRVLLVISDGRSGHESAQPISTEIQGVRIYCIGLDADGVDQRELLQRLASYTGGEATFANNPQDFRMAALRFTQQMGIAVR